MPEMEHTQGHVNCPACERAKHELIYGESFGRKQFPEAAALWLGSKKGISDRRRNNYRDYFLSLNKFFGELQLKDIHLGHIASYQQTRQEQIRQSRRHIACKRSGDEPQECDGASRINHEISALGQVLKQAGLWMEIKRLYEPLPLPKGSPGIALTEEEERHLFQIARTRRKWMVAYCCALISRNTTAGPGEIRHLRLCDVELGTPQGSFIHIEEGVKNEFRKRPVPLNADAEKAVKWLMLRAAEMGASEPGHFLLPHRALNRKCKPDPTRPMDSWKKAHRAMCKAAAQKFPRLARFRLYDYRHTAATDLLEDPSISYTTIEHMLGHRISSNTKRKYDHLRNSALRVAADALNRNHAREHEPNDGVIELPSRNAERLSWTRLREGRFGL